MNNIFQLRRGALAGALALASTVVTEAQPVSVTPISPARFQLYCPNAITQNFPTAGPAETTWLICWREVAGSNSIANPNGLVMGQSTTHCSTRNRAYAEPVALRLLERQNSVDWHR